MSSIGCTCSGSETGCEHAEWCPYADDPSPNGSNPLTMNQLPKGWSDYLYCRHFGNSADYPSASFRASCILGLATKQGKSWDKRLPVIADLFD